MDKKTSDSRAAQLLRRRMIREQIEARGLQDERVLSAMERVERHLFLRSEDLEEGYADRPVPLGPLQTISQPYMVALMTEAAKLPPTGGRVLEIGTGSGYSAAVLAQMGVEVYTMEVVRSLGEEAAVRLAEMGYTQIHTRVGDGALGWPEAAPFDAILVTAAPVELPKALLAQLKEGGRMVIPLGDVPHQQLLRLTREGDHFKKEILCAVRFVPMVSADQAVDA